MHRPSCGEISYHGLKSTDEGVDGEGQRKLLRRPVAVPDDEHRTEPLARRGIRAVYDDRGEAAWFGWLPGTSITDESTMTLPGTQPMAARFGILRIVFWVYLAGASLLLVSPLPFDVDQVGPAGKLAAITGVRMSTLGHFVLYAVGAVLALLSERGRFLRLVVLFVHGPAMELVQSFVPQRTAELSDVVADWAGVVVAVAAAPLLYRALSWAIAGLPGTATDGSALRRTAQAGRVPAAARASADPLSTS